MKWTPELAEKFAKEYEIELMDVLEGHSPRDGKTCYRAGLRVFGSRAPTIMDKRKYER